MSRCSSVLLFEWRSNWARAGSSPTSYTTVNYLGLPLSPSCVGLASPWSLGSQIRSEVGGDYAGSGNVNHELDSESNSHGEGELEIGKLT